MAADAATGVMVIHDPLADRRLALGHAGAARHDEADTREWTYIRKDGGRVPVSLTVTALRASDGSHSGFMGVAFDLSARKVLERELRRQAERVGPDRLVLEPPGIGEVVVETIVPPEFTI